MSERETRAFEVPPAEASSRFRRERLAVALAVAPTQVVRPDD